MKNALHSRAARSARNACGPVPRVVLHHAGFTLRVHPEGFTLLELMTALAITSMLVVMLFAAFNQASRAWTTAENRVETFTQARAALDFMAKELSQAIVTPNITFLADTNNLAFVAPLNEGTNAVDLMEVVYRLSRKSDFPTALPDPGGIFVDDPNVWPKKLVRRTAHFAAPAGAVPPGEGWDYGQGKACLVNKPWDFYTNPNWPETSAYLRTAVIAENIVSLRFDFYDSTFSPYTYWNSTINPGWANELSPSVSGGATAMNNRAPAGVQITIGIIDSKAAARLQPGMSATASNNIINQSMRAFSTLVAIPNRQP